jgi:hypothetical protein
MPSDSIPSPFPTVPLAEPAPDPRPAHRAVAMAFRVTLGIFALFACWSALRWPEAWGWGGFAVFPLGAIAGWAWWAPARGAWGRVVGVWRTSRGRCAGCGQEISWGRCPECGRPVLGEG